MRGKSCSAVREIPSQTSSLSAAMALTTIHGSSIGQDQLQDRSRGNLLTDPNSPSSHTDRVAFLLLQVTNGIINIMKQNKIMFAILGLVVFGLAVWAASMREPMGAGPGGAGPMGNSSSTQSMASSSVQTSSTNGGISITIETPAR